MPLPLDPEITFISGVTSDGKVAATSYFTWKGDDPPTYMSSSFVTLTDPLGTLGTFATGTNAKGQIVGYYIDSSGHPHGFLYSGGNYMTVDDPLGTNGTNVWGINASDQIVGSYRDSSGVSHGFLYSGGNYTTLDDPLGTKGTAVHGINDQGGIVGSYTDSNGVSHAFSRGTNSVYNTIDDPLGTHGSAAWGITNTGQVVGSYTDSNNISHGFLYGGGNYTTLDDPLGTNGTLPTGITAQGQIVGSYTDSNNIAHGFLYSGGSYYTLDDPSGITRLEGISTSAYIVQIVGSYRDGSGFHGLQYNPSRAFKWGSSTLSTSGGNVTYWFDTAHNWTTSERNALISGLALWSAETNITFSEAANASVANFTFRNDPNAGTSTVVGGTGATIGSGAHGSPNPTGNFINFQAPIGPNDIAYDNPLFDVGGNLAYHNIVHEEGHLIGLGHAGAYNGPLGEDQHSAYDSGLWSIMSYIEPGFTGAPFFNSYPVTGTDWGIDPTFQARHSTTPMILDVLAAQRIYGTPTSGPLAKGGQIFGFNCNIVGTATDASIHRYFDFTMNTHPIVTIWDGGTNNTLDLSGWSAPATINLTPGTFTSANGMVNNIAIAIGTVIDHAIGGKGDDIIIGSRANDSIAGGGGNDIIDGGDGTDTVIYRGPRSDYSITKYFDGAFTIKDSHAGSGEGIDSVKNVEFVQFADQTINVPTFPASHILPATVQNDFVAIMRVPLSLDQATTIATSFDDGTQTETQYVNSLLSQVANTTIPAVAVEASMYNATGTSAEITSLTVNFLPPQIVNATHWGLNAQVYACEALGLVFAFGNETGSTAFSSNFGPSNSTMQNTATGDAAFATAASSMIFGSASTANLVSVLLGFVSNWEAFYTAHGLPWLSNPSAAQIDLAARGAAWGDMVGVALANNLGELSGQTANFLEDAAQGTAIYSASLSIQPNHLPFQGWDISNSVQLIGVSAPVDVSIT